MKKIAFILLGSLFIACSPTVSFDENLFGNYQVLSTQDISQTEVGVIPVEVVARGESKEKALKLAKKYAVAAVLFKGIPNSSVKKPLFGSNISEHSKTYFTQFFNDGTYLRFVQRAEINHNETYKIKGGYEVNADIAVQYELLKEYLKENGLKSKFGI